MCTPTIIYRTIYRTEKIFCSKRSKRSFVLKKIKKIFCKKDQKKIFCTQIKILKNKKKKDEHLFYTLTKPPGGGQWMLSSVASSAPLLDDRNPKTHTAANTIIPRPIPRYISFLVSSSR